MTLPGNARLEAAPNFLRNLEATRTFFVVQDPDSATRRFAKLQAELREMISIIRWSPASGRPARFLNSRSAQGRWRAQALTQLANQAGLPEMREYLVDQHVVLYAHSETEVVLLALKHQRQLMYWVDGKD